MSNFDGLLLDLKPELYKCRVPCCLCRTENSVPVAVGEDFAYGTSSDTFLAMRCLACNLVYLNPQPHVCEFDRIYPSHYHAYDFTEHKFGLAYRARKILETRRLRSYSGGLGKEARILDVGSGDAFHMRLLAEFGPKGWNIEGIDASERAVIAARRAGFTVHLGTVESTVLPQDAYDLILLIATIEHVSNPVDVLASVRNLLRPGGRVVIVTDNTDTFDYKIFGRRHWGGYHFPRHFNLFDRKSLARLAHRASLTVESMQTTASPVNWVYSLRNWLVDLHAPAFVVECFSLRSAPALGVFTLLDMGFQKLGRGALLTMIARKSHG